jgi:hypothetical protein
VGERYWHELCFTGRQDPEGLIEAAEKAGFTFEFGSTEPEETFVGLPVQLEAAERRIAELEAKRRYERPRVFGPWPARA